MEIRIDEIESPIGKVVLAETDGVLCALDFEQTREPVLGRLKRRFGEFEVSRGNGVRKFRDRVEAYFQGELHALDGLAVEPGGTAFQRKVWSALQRIPVGSTTCYSELAASIGHPAAVRAVGMANSRNPIAVVIPCHRVIGRDGSLTGYAAGIERKRWLLHHEGHFPQPELKLF
jgi:methylated-DNA-[protein]-cysteine S-methyltransferase